MAQRGRPTLSDELRRDEQVIVMLRRRERAKIGRASARAKKPLSEWARDVLLKAAK